MKFKKKIKITLFMKNFLLFFFITILFSSSMHAKRTGCDGECENGTGTWTYTDQTVYTGEWVNSKKQGKGIETWPNGYVYEGEFFNSQWHGEGNLTFPDGSKYIGEWFEDNMNGQGTLTLVDGTVLKGIWKNGALVEPN